MAKQTESESQRALQHCAAEIELGSVAIAVVRISGLCCAVLFSVLCVRENMGKLAWHRGRAATQHNNKTKPNPSEPLWRAEIAQENPFYALLTRPNWPAG